MDSRYVGGTAIIILCTVGVSMSSLSIASKDVSEPEEPVWLQNIHKILPDWDPEKDTPIPDWAKPGWAVSPHGGPTEVSLHGPYSDNVEWLNASDVFTPRWDCSGAVYVDAVQGVFYTLDNITSCPDKGIVDFILAHRDKVGLAVFGGDVPEDDVPASGPGGGKG